MFKFKPPQDAVKAGVVRQTTWTDGRTANAEAKKLVETIDLWRNGYVTPAKIDLNSTFEQAVLHYQSSKGFEALSNSSKNTYRKQLSKVCETQLSSKSVGKIKISNFTAALCYDIYEEWLKKETTSNVVSMTRMFSIICSHLSSLDLMVSNPMAKIKKVTHKTKTVEWTKDQVSQFLDYCFSDFKYRSLGLLTYMAYEWAQRPVDIAHLKWEDLDLQDKVATITQSKRGATVYLPIEGKLLELLEKQKEDFDFQEYVIPFLRGDKAWRPMPSDVYSRLKNEVLKHLGLPLSLEIGSLRKTGIIEMFDEGVDLGTMMSVTGHKSLSSLDSYQKNTLKASKKALQQRKGID